MKYLIGLLLLCVGAGCAEPSQPAVAHQAVMSFQRIMIAGPNNLRLCTGAYGFQMKDKFINLDASAPECAELSKLDTSKPCTVLVSRNPEAPGCSMILSVEQNGKTFYTRPPATMKKE